jgi:hypothetical protein
VGGADLADPDREAIVAENRMRRERSLRWDRGLLGWAIFVARKP